MSGVGVSSVPPPLTFSAVCLTVENHPILIFDENAAGREEAFGPPVYVRFAFAPTIGKELLVPEKVVDDWGNEFSGPEIYEWIEKRGSMFPRADVVGATPEGTLRQKFMKELDLAAAPAAFAARTANEYPGVPIALALRSDPAVSGDLALDTAPPPHPLLARAVPCYAVRPEALGAEASLRSLLQSAFAPGGPKGVTG